MYSVVLMAALTAGTSTPDFHHRTAGCYHQSSCLGCYGCVGTSYGCHGGCFGGYGCYGGYGGHGGYSAGYSVGCYGCAGGCYGYGCYSSGYMGGYGCYGCTGGCYGYGCYSSGYAGGYSVGCYGCAGGCYGYGCYGSGYMSGYGCYGCTGGCYGFSCHGCYGHGPTTSCAGYNYAPGYTTPGYTTPGMPLYGNTVPGPVTNPSTNKPAQPSTNDNKTKASISNTPANLAIEVPADAKLYVDGKLTTSTSEVRKFVTPPLQQGQVYFYDLRAEVDRDGQRIAVNGRVIIRAGQNVRAQLSEPSQKGTFLVSAD